MDDKIHQASANHGPHPTFAGNMLDPKTADAAYQKTFGDIPRDHFMGPALDERKLDQPPHYQIPPGMDVHAPGESVGGAVPVGYGSGVAMGVGAGNGSGVGSGVGAGYGAGVGSGVGHGVGHGVGSSAGHGVATDRTSVPRSSIAPITHTAHHHHDQPHTHTPSRAGLTGPNDHAPASDLAGDRHGSSADSLEERVRRAQHEPFGEIVDGEKDPRRGYTDSAPTAGDRSGNAGQVPGAEAEHGKHGLLAKLGLK